MGNAFCNSKISNPQRGFTLIELLLVVGVTGIITVFSGLNLVGFQRRTTIRTATDELVSNLRKVQSLSISAKGNNSYGVHFEQDHYVIFTGPSYSTTDTENVTVSLPRNVTFANVNLSPNDTVVFSKLTGYPDYTGSFNLSLGAEVITVTINAEGVIDVLESGIIEIPDSFRLVSPGDGSVEDSTLTPDFDWEDSVGSGVTYELWHSTDQDFSTKVIVNAGTMSHVTLPDEKSLADNSRNYWKVKATNNQGFSTWSTQTWYIDTQVASPPTSFNLITPTDGETVLDITPNLDWGDSSDPDAGGVTYTLWVDDNSDFSSLSFEKTGLSSSEYGILPEDGLIPGNTYYWVVKAIDGDSSETWSNQQNWSFTISSGEAPTSFGLISPSDNTNIFSALPSFDWADSTDPDGGEVSYDLWIDDDLDFSSLILEKTGLVDSNYSLIPGEELPTGTYYWKVRAVDDENVMIWSNQQNWKVNVELNEAPGDFNLLSPIDGLVLRSTDITFDWEDSIDPNGDDSVLYTVLVDNDMDFSSPEINVVGLTASTYTVQSSDDLQNNETYYWKIVATDGSLDTVSSQSNWSFSIDADIYVDQSVSVSGDGTSWTQAFQTIEEAVNVLSSGDTVNIAGGTYNERISLNFGHSGSLAETTEFISKSGEVVNVTGGKDSGMRLEGAERVYFQRINFINTDRNGVELLNGAYDITFESCKFDGNKRDGIYANDTNNSNIAFIGGSSSNNGDEGVTLQGQGYILDDLQINNNGGEGIYLDDVSDSKLSNLQVNKNGEYGVRFYYGTDIELSDSQIINAGATRDRDGVYVYRATSIDINNNEIGSASRRGVYLYQLDSLAISSKRSEFARNVVYDSGDIGIYAYWSYGGLIYNNTSDGNRNGSGLYVRGVLGNLTIRNNNLTNNRYGLRVRHVFGSLDHDYANVWGNDSNYGNDGADYSGFNTISVNPLYVDRANRDYNLQESSGCIDAGDPSPIYNDPDGSRSDINALHYSRFFLEDF